MKKEKHHELKIVYRKITELRHAEYNPRKISTHDKQQIKQSLQESGFVQPLVVNIHKDRKNIVIGGNQRLIVARELGYEEVPIVEVELELEAEKRLNLRLNKNQGEFDNELLREFFEKEMLLEIGWREKELTSWLDSYSAKLNSITNADAEMPIVPKFSESYNVIMIFAKNELDYNYLKNVLKLEKSKSYKNSKIGETHVITAEHFQKILEGYEKN